MVYLKRVNLELFETSENYTECVQEAIEFAPDAVVVPGNHVPSFLPGLKVQVFHGFEWKKKGHFKIRDGFDLYCTQGPFFTKKFNQLARKFNYFDVEETGWPKLDPLYQVKPYTRAHPNIPCILYAPTFSPSLTSVRDLYKPISKISKKGNWHWLVKFHPKMENNWVRKFESIQHEHLEVVCATEIAPVLKAAHVILSDTSSIISEFMLLNRPAVTYKNIDPEDVLINFTEPNLLEQKLAEALQVSEIRLNKINAYNQQFHPYQDGLSASRILSAIERRLVEGKDATKPLPLNLFRNFKMRKQLKYWKL
jgi:CDP-glycerol glycerophosphotransferase (TagB/SpsB family)